MKILFIKENNDIEIKSVTVKDNKFTINQHLYLINNQLDKEVRDALYYTKFVSDALGFIKNDISQLLIGAIIGVVIGIIIKSVI